MITLKDIIDDEEVKNLIESAQDYLTQIRYTEHGFRHASVVSTRAGDILKTLGYDDETVELAKIAGFIHDIGNVVNRVDHAHTGAILAYDILKRFDLTNQQRLKIVTAIGNHDENTGNAVSEVSAALILADKSDVAKDRVVNTNLASFDIHDRVNYAVTSSNLIVNKERKKIQLDLIIDTKVCPVLDYFEIFLERTMMSKHAAKYLDLWFELIINKVNIL